MLFLFIFTYNKEKKVIFNHGICALVMYFYCMLIDMINGYINFYGVFI